MAQSLNRVELLGRLGRDPELKYTAQGLAVATFSMATSRGWKKADGTFEESTEWHRIVCWERIAEQANEKLHKGSRVYVDGRIQTREYTSGDSQKRFATEIVAQFIIPLERSEAGGPSVPGGEAEEDIPF